MTGMTTPLGKRVAGLTCALLTLVHRVSDQFCRASNAVLAGRRLHVRLAVVALVLGAVGITVQTVAVLHQAGTFAHQVVFRDLARKGKHINYALEGLRSQETRGGSGETSGGSELVRPGTKEEAVSALLSSLADLLDVRIWLFDPEGRVVATSERGETLPGVAVPSGVTRDVLAGRTVEVFDWLDGNAGMPAVALPMGSSEAVEGGIILVPRTSPVEPALARLGWRLMLLGALALIAMVALSLWVAESLSRPLEQIAGVVAGMARGDTGARVSPEDCQGYAEVADLASQVNQLAERFASAHRDRFLLFAELSHELKSPLTVIMGYLDAVATASEPEEAAEYQRIVSSEVEYLKQLVENLIDLGRLESGIASLSFTPVDLAALARGVAQAMQPAAAARGNVLNVTHDVKGAVWVSGDPGRLEQVLRNLVSNAIAATEGGSIHIRVRVHGGEAVVEVEDDGIGIPPEVLSHIWRHFYRHPSESAPSAATAPDRPRGTGLGLAITRRLVELHNGRIEVRSEVGEGSCFRVVLPLSALPGSSQLR